MRRLIVPFACLSFAAAGCGDSTTPPIPGDLAQEMKSRLVVVRDRANAGLCGSARTNLARLHRTTTEDLREADVSGEVRLELIDGLEQLDAIVAQRCLERRAALPKPQPAPPVAEPVTPVPEPTPAPVTPAPEPQPTVPPTTDVDASPPQQKKQHPKRNKKHKDGRRGKGAFGDGHAERRLEQRLRCAIRRKRC